MSELTENILLNVTSKIMDPVTTTDELIPSGETSSFRSNPSGLAEFTLSRRDPGYVGRSKEIAALEQLRVAGTILAGCILNLRTSLPKSASCRDRRASPCSRRK